MRKIFVAGIGIAGDPTPFMSEPSYRKATRNMILANDSVTRALASVPREIVLADCGYVLGSCHGELEVTINFLKTFSETGVARPILFQNSLHNSTAGFVSMALKLSGPLLTVSNLHFTGEEVMETAICLLQQNSCGFCLVTSVEARVPELVQGLKDTKLRRHYTGEGAASLLLCNDEGLKKLDQSPIAELTSLRCIRDIKQTFVESENYYESNGIECFVRAILSSEKSLSLSKPDGSHSEFQWQ
jgi:hypothetical protein